MSVRHTPRTQTTQVDYDDYDDDDVVVAARPSRMQRVHRIGSNVGKVGHGLPMVFVGVLSMAFFLMASVLHIQTTEAFFLSLAHVGLSPDWSILSQPYDAFTGKYGPAMTEAVIAAWIVEIAFLILTVGYEYLVSMHAATSPKRATYFKLGIRVLVALDAFSDFNYGSVSSSTGWIGQAFFACLMAFAVLFLGTSGWHMMVKGLRDWSASNA